MTQPHINAVENAIQAFKNDKMVILTDDANRENEGDLIFPAECITPEIINFMIQHCSGIICLSLSSHQIKKLGLRDMVPHYENNSRHRTPFTISIEAKEGVTTGVSAADRAKTILTAVDEQASENDIATPGHIFPLRANGAGVLGRAGHTEGAFDLAKLAGFSKGAVLCELMNPDGTMTKGKSLELFSIQFDIPLLSIADLIAYRRTKENLIETFATTKIPIESLGEFDCSAIKEKYSGVEHLVLSKSKTTQNNPIVRIHSSCLTGDLFMSERCDCCHQLMYSLKKISVEGGILIYLNQEGRGIGLLNKIKAYALQESGLDTLEANKKLGLPIDAREYYIAANILRNRNISHIRLLTNNNQKIDELIKYGIHSIERLPMPIFSNTHNQFYLKTKKEKLNHLIGEII